MNRGKALGSMGAVLASATVIRAMAEGAGLFVVCITAKVMGELKGKDAIH